MNRFTEQLLSIPVSYSGYIAWFDIQQIVGKLPGVSTENAPYLFVELDENFIQNKQTFICLLAAMSNKDIDELIINWKEHNHG